MEALRYLLRYLKVALETDGVPVPIHDITEYAELIASGLPTDTGSP